MQKNYDLTRDGHYLNARIGFEKPMGAFTTNFFMPGPAVPHLPRIAATGSYLDRTESCVATTGSYVPFVYGRSGYVQFSVAKWEPEKPTGKNTDHFRSAEPRSLGFPGMIPASFIDLALDPEDGEDDAIAVRLRSAVGDALFIGCRFAPNDLNNAVTLTVLVSEPGPDIAPYTDWQPVIIPVSFMPTTANSDFIFRRDHGRLQVPSPWGSLKVEKLH